MIPSTAVHIDHSKDVANKRAEEVTDAGADADSRASLTLPVAPGFSTLASSYVEKNQVFGTPGAGSASSPT